MIERIRNYFSRYAVRNLSALSLSQAVEFGSGLIYSVLVVRFLGGVVYGQLLVVISGAKMLDQILQLKLENPLTTTLRQALDAQEEERFHRQNTAAIILTCLSSTIGFVLLLLAGTVEASLDFFQLGWIRFAAIFFASFSLRHLRNIIFSNFQAAQLFGNLSYLKVISSLSLNFVPLLLLRHGILGIALGYLTGEIFIVLSYSVLMLAPFSRRKTTIPRFEFDPASVKSLFELSWKYYQAKLLDRVSVNLGNIMIAHAGGPRSLSFFNIGQKFFKFNVVVFPALRNYLFPRLVQKWSQRKEEFFYTLRKYLLTSSVFTLVTLSALSLVVPYLLPALYGLEFVPAVTAFMIMVPGYLMGLPPGSIFREVCFATENISLYRTLKLVANPLYLLALYPLTLQWGFIGAALAWSLYKAGIGLFDGWWFWTLYRNREP